MELLGLAGALSLGASAGIAAWWVVLALQTEDLSQDAEWRYDVTRINSLRRIDLLYRLLQPVVRVLGRLNRAAWGDGLREVQREILAAGLPRYWLPEEYLARAQIIALLLLPGYLYFCITYMGPPGIVTGIGLCLATAWLLRRRLTTLARRRLQAIKRRMPFFLDLMTLLMEAGASFLNALKQAVREFEGHAVAEEFGRVLTDMNMGKPRSEAFDNLRQRLADDEIASIVGSILQSEQLGTPLAAIFRTQADVLRVKRSQRAETIAGEAGVNMLLPGVLIMASTVLVIVGPFILGYLASGLGI